MNTVLYVALGGALGAVLRYVTVQQIVMRLHSASFPLGTMLVNVIGSFLIGIIVAKFLSGEVSDNLRAFLVIGVLGGFTTFSAFSIDVLQLFQRGEILQAALYICGSVICSVTACAFGFWWVARV